jgi:predicted nuclease of predicted toxin-antitoxin system
MHGFVIVTRDADYYDKIITLGFPPKLVWITGGNASTSQVTSLLMAHEADVKQLEFDPECGCLELRVIRAVPRAT